ncbi:fin bud initiation factor homolog [Petromyzon marinus]|uniref:Fin bud initiation factor homolog n=1 Tax=Petromyzon marinus TaxID=7757 RepID=A0AAJ7WP26_PETMA|nr:fin bud initiation factor homolog [Petromyzon marinus]
MSVYTVTGALLFLCTLGSSPAAVDAGVFNNIYPEVINNTLHYYFVPDGVYDDEDGLDKCLVEFDLSGRRLDLDDRRKNSWSGSDLDGFRRETKDDSRVLESLLKVIQHDTDGAESYGRFLRSELSTLGQAFGDAATSLQELESKLQAQKEALSHVVVVEELLRLGADSTDLLGEVLGASASSHESSRYVESLVHLNDARLTTIFHKYIEAWQVHYAV